MALSTWPLDGFSLHRDEGRAPRKMDRFFLVPYDPVSVIYSLAYGPKTKHRHASSEDQSMMMMLMMEGLQWDDTVLAQHTTVCTDDEQQAQNGRIKETPLFSHRRGRSPRTGLGEGIKPHFPECLKDTPLRHNINPKQVVRESRRRTSARKY
ncbi:hypothetical protein EVAR_98776_1 [Eumeta japonica]|uniref:Uncharacterized protein n=1 Tax=Eumeta variegata TaxID=151549 RepID=A0A4C1YWS0_EUMVA|nr:hypothetical protein EVAR_98776_1 [Eumeta japonica]